VHAVDNYSEEGQQNKGAEMKKRRYLGMFLSILGTVFMYALLSHKAPFTSGSDLSNIKFKDAIVDASKQHDLPPALITAVIHAESNFNPRATSYAGAKGLMQINAPTQRFLRLKNVYDPSRNIEAGARYLKNLIEQFEGNLVFALAAYNAGPGAVKKYNGVPPYSETRSYVKKVLSYYQQYRQAFSSGPLTS
jgi:soluble lytic murein transglycosylase-like protein